MGRLDSGTTLTSEVWMEIHRSQMTEARWALVKQQERSAILTGQGRSKNRYLVSFRADQDTHERVLVFRDFPKMTSAEVRLIMEEREERGNGER